MVSIIVPIYNAEKYIRQCLDSILAQTYTKWEAILVNDGSPDNSGKICNEYANKDNRFRVIHQQNGGVSVARQTGLDNVTGNYIIHCDPDDWIDPNMLEDLISKAKEENADMVICDFLEHMNQTTQYISENITPNASAKEVQKRIINQQTHGSCCNKLIKKECCANIKFMPKDISLGEDELFIVRVLNRNIKISYINNAYYHYRRDNSDSICSSRNEHILLSRMKVIEEYEKILDKKEYNNFFNIKRDVLISLFVTKNLKQLKYTYKEIHPQIISTQKRYSFRLPLGYFFPMGLKSNPYIAYYLYKLHMIVFNTFSFTKHLLKSRTSITTKA